MEQNDRIVFVTMSSSESCTNIAPHYLRLDPEMSFEAPVSLFIKDEESGLDAVSIRKLTSYYGSALKSLSE
ncbi:MAG: hypothetical protein AB7S83_03940 [Candidatus Methanomethylophilaceae archaeon]|jgi:hypothetical protein